MAFKYFSVVVIAVFAFWVVDLVHPAQDGDFECYDCKQGNGELCDDEDIECFEQCQEKIETCHMSRPVCEIEVKNHGEEVYVIKRCRQEEACSNQVAKNDDSCYDYNSTTIVSGCTYCCNETLCNYNQTTWYDYRTGDAPSFISGAATFCGLLVFLMFHRF